MEPELFNLNIELTEEDYRQANVALQRAVNGRETRWTATAVSLLTIFALVGLVFLLRVVSPSATGRTAPMPPAMGGTPTTAPAAGSTFLGVFFPFLPWLIAGLVIAQAVYKLKRRDPPKRELPPEIQIKSTRAPIQPVIGTVSAVSTLMFLTILVSVDTRYVAGSLQRLLPFWLVFICMLCILVINGRKRQIRKMWDGQPLIGAHQIMVVTDHGFSLTHSLLRHDYKWAAIRRFIETPELILLMFGDLSFQMVPKRAFASPQLLDEFRGLLRAKIQPTLNAFPVMQSVMMPASRSSGVAS